MQTTIGVIIVVVIILVISFEFAKECEKGNEWTKPKFRSKKEEREYWQVQIDYINLW